MGQVAVLMARMTGRPATTQTNGISTTTTNALPFPLITQSKFSWVDVNSFSN